jgi:cellulose 1,4-beta-cellobiosidase
MVMAIGNKLSMRRLSVASLIFVAACGASSAQPTGGNGPSDGTGGNSSAGGTNGGGTNGGATGGTGSGATGGTGGGGASTVDTTQNPFAGAQMYVNPDYQKEVQSSMAASPSDAAQLGKMKQYSTAIWLDTMAKVADVGRYLDDAAAQQKASGQPVVTTFVIYDLPNRDCAAQASNGELTVDNGGLDTYKTQYIDKIAAVFRAHPDQRIVGIVEPDSLPNLATNMSIPKCSASASAYRDGVAYAIRTLAAGNVSLYLDAAHAGWLGWPDNMTKIATIFDEVLTAAGGADKIRGFATNTANYTELHATTELYDYQFNPCHDELTYVQKLTDQLAQVGIVNKGFVIDTSRNGRGGIRHLWGSWCNVEGAGIGERPVADPLAGIDAYYWVKPPGESDGTADASAARFDSFCANQDATPGAPQAGTWFHSYFVDLVKNAVPAL